jgi:hypothetical protein
MFVAEDPPIALIPNLPNNKESARGDGLAVWRRSARHGTPPMLDRVTHLKDWLNVRDAHPNSYVVPNKTDDVSAIDRKCGTPIPSCACKGGQKPQLG